MEKHRDWIIAVTLGCLVILLTSSLWTVTRWGHWLVLNCHVTKHPSSCQSQNQLRRRNQHWLGHMLRRRDDSTSRQVLRWATKDQTGRAWPKNMWKQRPEERNADSRLPGERWR